MTGRRMRLTVLTMLALASAAPAHAQSAPADLNQRLRAIETDVRALKRQVLPSGKQRLIEPEVDTTAGPTPEQQAVQAQASAVGDLATRISALERAQQRLTAQIEEFAQRSRQTDDAQVKLRADLEARLVRLEGPVVPPASQPGGATLPILTPPPPSAAGSVAPTPAATSRPSVATATGPDEAYKLAYAPVEAKDWPRAETDLQTFLKRYPKHRLASFARYWLGRTYYAQGRFEESARTHTANYDADARGERAQESLYWVGQSLAQLNRQSAACQVYDLAHKVYADEMKAELRPQFAAARTRAGCS